MDQLAVCYLVAVVVVLLAGSCAGGAGFGILAGLGRADVAGVPGGPDTDEVNDVQEVLLTAPVLRVEQEDVVAKC